MFGLALKKKLTIIGTILLIGSILLFGILSYRIYMNGGFSSWLDILILIIFLVLFGIFVYNFLSGFIQTIIQVLLFIFVLLGIYYAYKFISGGGINKIKSNINNEGNKVVEIIKGKDGEDKIIKSSSSNLSTKVIQNKKTVLEEEIGKKMKSNMNADLNIDNLISNDLNNTTYIKQTTKSSITFEGKKISDQNINNEVIIEGDTIYTN